MSKSNISTKKLKAIVFTDIVDFTKLSANDEQKALDIINFIGANFGKAKNGK